MALLSRPRRSPAATLRLFYASDVHGSDVCWRKFINAASHYDAQALIMGGDLTGKALVPVVREDGAHRAWVIGEERRAVSPEEKLELERAIRMNGFYPLEMSADEHQAMRVDASLREQQFARAMVEGVERWAAFAVERLGESGIPVFVMPGNDDPWSIDDILHASPAITSCDDRIVRVGGHEMISCAYSNRTPWNSPRELDESDLYEKIRRLAESLESPETSIFNLHVPPYGSGLDTAIELDDDLRPVLKGGRPHEIPVGSTAVRQLIEEIQPLVSLHGHIHESRGVTHIGRTVVLNPGSDYASGRIDGCVVDLDPERVRAFRLVSG